MAQRNPPATPSNEDFTEAGYRRVLDLSSETGRQSVAYDSIPWGESYLLWRHDIDFSLNRSFRLAAINSEHSIHSTFFVQLHSPFYNLFELSQAKLLRSISRMGHDIGIHFDAAFYGDVAQNKLDYSISWEADVVAELIGQRPVAVSFHNPTERLLKLGTPTLGGLVNAYSDRLMAEAKYCSDSNGYWRYERLADVVVDESNHRLQVLTHPGWWLEEPAPPRQRIQRAVSGRARATMEDYDRTLRDAGRQNRRR